MDSWGSEEEEEEEPVFVLSVIINAALPLSFFSLQLLETPILLLSVAEGRRRWGEKKRASRRRLSSE